MKASELLGREVVTDDGVCLGIVHDMRARIPVAERDDDVVALPPTAVVALVVGPDTYRCRLAHAWGFAQGHARGPALLRLAVGRDDTRRVPVVHVTNWDHHGRIQVRGGVA